MKLHCSINRKPLTKAPKYKKHLKVEFIYNGGYWAKWYEVLDTNEAKELFKQDYPTGQYLRTKNY